MKKFLFLLVVMFSAFSLWAQKDGKSENKFNVSGNFQSDLQYYFEDQKIGAVAVDEKLLSNSYANFMISYGKFSAGVRFEGYYNTLLGFPNSGGKNDGFGVPSYWANFTNDKLEVTVGHFYEQFGNGLTLRSYEEKSLGIDNAILGARVKYTIVPGVNIKGIIGKQRYYWKLSDGILRGVDGEIQFNEMIKSLNDSQFRFGIGGSFVSKYQKEDNPIYNLPNNVATGAGRINIGYSGFNLISEYAYKINDPSADNNYIYRPGQAFLINATYSQKGLGVILSTKWVDNMSLRSDRNATLSDVTVSYLPEITRNYTYVLQAFYPYASQPMGEWGAKGEFFYKFKKGSKLGGKYGTTITLNYSRVHNIKKTALNDSTPIGTSGTYGYNTSLFAIGNELYYQDINVEISKKWSKKWYTNIAYMNLFYNYMAFANDFGVDTAFASRIAASFGGGIGRMREVCGTVCGMAMCASFIAPADDPSDKAARTANYALVQEFAEKFRAENGDIICRRLLGLPDDTCPCPEPSTRNTEFYKKRPCVEYVAYATRLVAEKIAENDLAIQAK